MKGTLLFVVLLFTSILGFGQCPDSPIILTSQAQVDDFATNYPGCTDLLEDLTISGDDIVDLTPLSQISSISGSLRIQDNLLLSNLVGLENIVFTGDSLLIITNNTQLISVNGLQGISLDELNGGPLDFNISNNPMLLNLDGLEAITAARGVFITNNNSLENIDGLIGLTSTQVPNGIGIENNMMLESITGLSNMVGDVFSLFVLDNPSLVSLEGLGGVTSFGFELVIVRNDLIVDLNGLEGVENFDDQFFFTIGGNNSLSDISVLENYTFSPIDIVTISQNPLLSICNYSGICENIAIGNEYYISDNAPGCETALEVAESCGICSLDLIELTSQNDIDTFADVYGDCSVLARDLFISGADITNLLGVSQIETVAGSIIIENNPLLASLNGLENIEMLTTDGTSKLMIRGNPILENLDGLSGLVYSNGKIEIEDNQLLQSITGLSNLTGNINSFTLTNCPQMINLNGLEGVTGITNDLFLASNGGLIVLNGLQNVLNNNVQGANLNVSLIDNEILNNIETLANLNSSSISSLNIMGNSLLSECDILSFCNFISNAGTTNISNNAENCNTENEILEFCNEELNFIEGIIRYDSGNDGCQVTDINIPSALVQISYGSSTISTVSNQEGVYSSFVPADGIVTTLLIEDSLPSIFTASPASVETTFVGSGITETIDFCISSPNPFDDLKITLLPLDDARPGFNSKYLVVYENIGTTILEGTIEFTFNDERQEFFQASETVSSQGDDSIVFDYEIIFPFEQRTIEIEMYNFEPPVNDSGDELDFLVNVFPFDNDVDITNNTDGLKQIMVNSFDPNDKQVAQGEGILEEEVGEFLNYLIRFQNLGTASAINVRVEDVLSENLDWNTFRTLSSSHDYRTEIIDGNQVAFIFDDINLPPEEQDEDGSNGYIAFQIRTNDDLQLGDSVDNTASIFFDFNAPIITNTVVTTVVKPLNVEEQFLVENITLFPNPASEILTIQTSQGIAYKSSTIYNVIGKQIVFSEEKSINVSSISAGIYFIAVETEQGVLTQKIIVE